MQYLAWRVLASLNRKIEISFLLVGHTKFAPDWCFGLLKQKFRKSLVGCLEDLVRVVNQSASSNHAQLLGLEDGTPVVDQHDWAGFFQPYFRRGAFDGIKSWHHLVFSSAAPGQAMVRTLQCRGEDALPPEETTSWLEALPTRPASCLTTTRASRRYLHDKIRDCPGSTQGYGVSSSSTSTTSISIGHIHSSINHIYPISIGHTYPITLCHTHSISLSTHSH